MRSAPDPFRVRGTRRAVHVSVAAAQRSVLDRVVAVAVELVAVRRVVETGLELVLVGGTAGVIAVVGFILAAVGVMGFGIPFIAAIVAVVCGLIFRRTVSR